MDEPVVDEPVVDEPVVDEPVADNDHVFLAGLFRETPIAGQGGYFLRIHQGDEAVNVFRPIVPGASGIDIYKAISLVKWNVRLYGAKAQKGKFATVVDPDGVAYNLQRGFLPRHMDARAHMLATHTAPVRSIHWKGGKKNNLPFPANSYMDVWVPSGMYYDPAIGIIVPSTDPNHESMNPPQRALDILGVDDIKVMG